jgi:hypothetical protein
MCLAPGAALFGVEGTIGGCGINSPSSDVHPNPNITDVHHVRTAQICGQRRHYHGAYTALPGGGCSPVLLMSLPWVDCVAFVLPGCLLGGAMESTPPLQATPAGGEIAACRGAEGRNRDAAAIITP